MPAILISILAAVINGQSLGAVLAALTTAQWLTLAEGAAVDLAPELAKLLGIKASGNSLGTLIDSVAKAATDDLVKAGVRDWLADNGAKAIELQPGIAGQ